MTGNLVLQGGITDDGSLRTDGAALYWADGAKVLRMPFETEEVAGFSVLPLPVPHGHVEVLGFRRFSESEFSGDAPPTVVRCVTRRPIVLSEREMKAAFVSMVWPRRSSST